MKTETTIRNNVHFDPYQSFDIIPLKPLSSKRQAQLFVHGFIGFIQHSEKKINFTVNEDLVFLPPVLPVNNLNNYWYILYVNLN